MATLADTGRAVYRLPQAGQGGAAATPKSQASAMADEQLLAENALWFCSLRWLVAAGLLGLGLIGPLLAERPVLNGLHLERGWPLTVAGVLVIMNLVYVGVLRAAAVSPRRAAVTLRCLWFQIVLDLVVLTGVVHFMGSLETYAPLMYLFHIVLACIFFPSARSLRVTLWAMGMYLACVALETSGLLPARSPVVSSLATYRSAMPPAVTAWHLGSVVFISATVWYLASHLARALREREMELAETNRRLVAATDERAAHMLRTTHQMKAPFAAIHANAQLLLGGYCGVLPEAAIEVIEQVSVRCEKLSREIKAMLQLANLRSSAQGRPGPAAIDLPALLGTCLTALKPDASKRGILLEEDFCPATVRMAEDHAVMILENVISNAVNYSCDGGKVWVSCRPGPGGGAEVTVRDQGIGIPADKLAKVFDDYFRTNEAARHNRASTGLGLAIVRQVALAGQIGVSIESAPGQGTLVSLDFPATARQRGKPN